MVNVSGRPVALAQVLIVLTPSPVRRGITGVLKGVDKTVVVGSLKVRVFGSNGRTVVCRLLSTLLVRRIGGWEVRRSM